MKLRSLLATGLIALTMCSTVFAAERYDGNKIIAGEGIPEGYYCLYKEKLPGLSKYVIPKSKWIVFIIDSQEAEDIRRVSQKFYKTMFLNLQYNIRPLPELEYYHDGITEFLIPIED